MRIPPHNWPRRCFFCYEKVHQRLNHWALPKKTLDLQENTSNVCLGCGNEQRELVVVGKDLAVKDDWTRSQKVRVVEQQCMKFGATHSCSLCFSPNITALEKKRHSLGRLRDICSTTAGVGCEGTGLLGCEWAVCASPIPSNKDHIIPQLSLVPPLISQSQTIERCLEVEAKKIIKRNPQI